jgi:hypothetical protein
MTGPSPSFDLSKNILPIIVLKAPYFRNFIHSTLAPFLLKFKFRLNGPMKFHRGSRGIALLFFNRSARWGWVVDATSQPIYLQEKIRYPFNSRLGGLQGLFGRLRKTSPPTEIRYTNRPARSESLYRLKYTGPLRLRFGYAFENCAIPAFSLYGESSTTKLLFVTTT